MNTQESQNDYFVCGFEGATNNMVLVEAGKGGMARVKEVLKESFVDKTAVAMFRVTAVDDRENTVSYRTKLIHVIYTGPQTPVMKRAKIASFNAAFKQPFSCNLSMQTDDVDGDLSETSIEKSLRASGGAHQPTRFDFDNLSAPGEKVIRTSKSPSHSPADSPAPERSFAAAESAPKTEKQPEQSYDSSEAVIQRHKAAFGSKDIDIIAADYASDAQLLHTDASTQKTTVYRGPSEISEFFSFFIGSVGDNEFTSLKSDVNGNIVTYEFENKAAGYQYAHEVFYIMQGKIQLQALTTVGGSAQESAEPAVAEEPMEEPAAADEPTEEFAEEAGESAPVAEAEESTPAQEEEHGEAHQETYEEEARELAGELAAEEEEAAPKEENVDEESYQKLEESEAQE
jgi:hypothetical protein